MKNIAILSTSLNSGGAERIAGLLSKELAKYYNVFLFLLDTERIVYEYGGEIVDIGDELPFFEHRVAAEKKLKHIDISISFMEIMNFANIRTRGTDKVIISERCVQSLFQPSLDAQTIKIRKYYGSADAIVACSHGVKYDLLTNYSIKNEIDVIYNFINKEKIRKLSEEDLPESVETFLNGASLFLNVARLHPQKNQISILNAFEQYLDSNKNCKLIFLGSGELEEKINEEISNRKLNDFVKVVPYDSNPFRYMKRAKTIILASRFEGLPNAVLETMTIGCPIIATDCLAGPRELLGDYTDYSEQFGNGISVLDRGILLSYYHSNNELDIKLLIEAMRYVNDNQQAVDDMKRQQQAYMNEYSNAIIVGKWIDLIENIEGNRRIKHEEATGYDSRKKTFIYGMGMVGTATFLSIREKIPIDGFVVSRKEEAVSDYMGIPVYDVKSIPYANEESQFILGTIENTQDELVRELYRNGYSNIVMPYVTPSEESMAFVKNYRGEK